MRVALDREEIDPLIDIQQKYGGTPGREIDLESGHFVAEPGQFRNDHISNAARLRGVPYANYTPPPGNTTIGFFEELKKIPWPVWVIGGIAVFALIFGAKE